MKYRSGFLGLVGNPNAGKSTLLNYLVDEKVSIVSSKPQTTRRRVLGISTSDMGQVVFVDAPGFVEAEAGLNHFLHKEALEVCAESDALIAVLALDTEKPEMIEKTIELVAQTGKPWQAVITKVDLFKYEHRLMRVQDMIKAKGGKFHTLNLLVPHVEDRETLLAEFMEMLPESPKPLFDTEIFTTETVRNLTAEIIREKCFENLHQEIPYGLAVRIMKFDETSGAMPKISAEIIVSKPNHKSIVIGKEGSMLKKIGSSARPEIEMLMETQVFLQLHVTVEENWMKNKKIMKDLGYDSESKLD